MTTLDYALAYIARGWSVIPLKPGTKEPAVKLARFLSGEERFTVLDAQSWWGEPGVHRSESTEYGIAIVCGAPSGGLVVVDVDPRNGGECPVYQAPYPIARTGGGGWHIFCQGEGLVPKGKTARPGIDRQGEGSYVVAAPSVHPSGDAYYWMFDKGWEDPLLPLPAWTLEKPVADRGHSGESPSGDTSGWIASALGHPDLIAPGTQEETLTRLAWWAAGTLDRDIAQALLEGWAGRLPLGDPRNPWTEAHVTDRLDRAYANRPRDFVVASSAASGASATSPAVDDLAELEAAIVSSDQYVVAKREDWIVEHLVAPGCWTEILGEVKKGKTTFNGMMIDSVLNGRDFLGWKVRRTPVVFHSEQVGLSLEATLERAGIRRHPDLYLLDQSKTFGKPWPTVVAALLSKCQKIGSQLLFVDTLTRLAGVGGDGENASGVVQILDPFRAAKAMGIAVVFVRHAGKSRENREDVSRAGRGSTALTGDMDIAVNLYQPGSEDVRRVRTISRLGEDLSVLLRYNGSGYEVVDEREVPATAGERKRNEIRERVESEFRAGNHTQAGIARALGLDRKTVARYLREVTGGLTIESGESSVPEEERYG